METCKTVYIPKAMGFAGDLFFEKAGQLNRFRLGIDTCETVKNKPVKL